MRVGFSFRRRKLYLIFVSTIKAMKRSAEPVLGIPVKVGDEPDAKRVLALRYMPFSLEQHLTTLPWIEVSNYTLRKDGTGIDVKLKALKHGKQSSTNLFVYQVIRRDIKGTDKYHDKAYFLEAWNLGDTGEQIDGFVTPASWFAADRIEDRNATAKIEATAWIVQSKLSLKAQGFRKSRDGIDPAGNTWFTDLSVDNPQLPPPNTPYLVRDVEMLHRRGKLTVDEDRGYFVDLADGKSKRTYELNPDRVREIAPKPPVKKRKGDPFNKHYKGSGRGMSFYEVHPVFGTRQRGAGLPESAVSVLRHLVHKYGLPAVNQFFTNMTDYNRLEMFPGVTEKPGNASMEMKFMGELARQHGMGAAKASSKWLPVDHTVGESAKQVVLAGSGQPAVRPGFHRMSNFEIMPNAEQTGDGLPSMLLHTMFAASLSAPDTTNALVPQIQQGMADVFAQAFDMNKASADLYMATGLKPNDPILQEDSDTDADVSTDDDNEDDNEISVEESYKRAPALRRLMDTVKERKNVAQSPSTPTRVQGATLDWKSHLQKQGIASAPMQDTIVASAPKVEVALSSSNNTTVENSPAPIENLSQTFPNTTRKFHLSQPVSRPMLPNFTISMPDLTFATSIAQEGFRNLFGARDDAFTDPAFGSVAGEGHLLQFLTPFGALGGIYYAQRIGQRILIKLRQSNLGTVIDRNTGEPRAISTAERELFRFVLGGKSLSTTGVLVRSLAIAAPLAFVAYRSLMVACAGMFGNEAADETVAEAATTFAEYVSQAEGARMRDFTQNLQDGANLVSQAATFASDPSLQSAKDVGQAAMSTKPVRDKTIDRLVGLGMFLVDAALDEVPGYNLMERLVGGDPVAEALKVAAHGGLTEQQSANVDITNDALQQSMYAFPERVFQDEPENAVALSDGSYASAQVPSIGQRYNMEASGARDFIEVLNILAQTGVGVSSGIMHAVQRADQVNRGVVAQFETNPKTQVLGQWLRQQNRWVRLYTMVFDAHPDQEAGAYFALVSDTIRSIREQKVARNALMPGPSEQVQALESVSTRDVFVAVNEQIDSVPEYSHLKRYKARIPALVASRTYELTTSAIDASVRAVRDFKEATLAFAISSYATLPQLGQSQPKYSVSDVMW